MTWPFENDTRAITKKLAKESLKSEKRRNFMIIIAISPVSYTHLPWRAGTPAREACSEEASAERGR